MLMCLNNNTCLARYEYDSFGNCTVYDGDGKINTDANFIGNINPFRWKSFYFDTESNLYYANGSYYDPETGMYLDAAPISTAIDNALKTRSLDRNGLMCNNTIELAGNPYTIEPATGLSSDPTYNPTDKLPNWLKRRIARQKRLQEIYNRIPWYAKVIVGTVLLAASIALTLVSRTGGAGVASIFIQLALGIGIGVGTYLASSLLTDTFTPEGLLNTVLDTFVITSAVIFISANINYLKYLARSKPVTTGELTGNDKFLQFESQTKLEEHFRTHASEFKELYKTPQEYLQGANYVINNGVYVPEMNGYVRFWGTGHKGAEYAFVGLTHDKTFITTYGIRSISKLTKISWLQL